MGKKKKVKSIKDLRDKYEYKNKLKQNSKELSTKEQAEVNEKTKGYTDSGTYERQLKDLKNEIREDQTTLMKSSKKVPVKSIKDLKDIKKKRDKESK